MNLNELIAEYEKFLDQMAECEWEPKELFRGDNRTYEQIKSMKGFFPKANGRNRPVIRELIYHCTKNGYGGPFISTSRNKNTASGFGKLYRINAGCQVVAQSNWERINSYYAQFEQALGNGRDDYAIEVINGAGFCKRQLHAALQYHQAQDEVLVINHIPIQAIKEV